MSYLNNLLPYVLILLFMLWPLRKRILSWISTNVFPKPVLHRGSKSFDVHRAVKKPLEKAAKKQKLYQLSFAGLVLFSLLGIYFLTYFVMPKYADPHGKDMSFFIFLAFSVFVTVPYLPIFLYKRFYKEGVLPAVAASLGYSYEAKEGQAWKELALKEKTMDNQGKYTGKDSALFGAFNDGHVQTEDGFSGFYDQKKISFQEIRLTIGRHNSLVFQGLLLCFDNNNPIEVPVIIRQKAAGLEAVFKNGLGFNKKIKLEDPQFEKNFDVYSMDEIKSRAILTPRFMERLKGISEFYGGAPVMAAFYDEKVFIAIKLNQDLFEPASFFTDARSKRNIELILAQIELQHQVVDSLTR